MAGKVLNTDGLISNLTEEACAEVPFFLDANGVTPTRSVRCRRSWRRLTVPTSTCQLLAVEAALLDLHKSAELPIDQIKALADEMLDANGDILPAYV
nr:hypothetical protein [Cohnella sp. OV330]